MWFLLSHNNKRIADIWPGLGLYCLGFFMVVVTDLGDVECCRGGVVQGGGGGDRWGC